MKNLVQKVGDIVVATDTEGLWGEDADRLCIEQGVAYVVEVYEGTLDVYKLDYGWVHSYKETAEILRDNKISRELSAEIILSNPEVDEEFKYFMRAWSDGT